LLVYWILFLYFAVGAMREQPRAAGSGRVDIPFRVGCLMAAFRALERRKWA